MSDPCYRNEDPAMTSMAPDPSQRKDILRQAHYNVQMLPPERVPFDFSTDSLQHHVIDLPSKSSRAGTTGGMLGQEFQAAVEKVFGFPCAVPLSQGRLAEAIVSKLLIRSGMAV